MAPLLSITYYIARMGTINYIINNVCNTSIHFKRPVNETTSIKIYG